MVNLQELQTTYPLNPLPNPLLISQFVGWVQSRNYIGVTDKFSLRPPPQR